MPARFRPPLRRLAARRYACPQWLTLERTRSLGPVPGAAPRPPRRVDSRARAARARYRPAAPAAVQGKTLLPATRGERLELLALSESWYPRYHYGWSELTAVRDGRYTFVAAPRRELYDTDVDPAETNDLSAANPRLADALERALQQMVAKTHASKPQAPQQVDADVEE